MTSRAAPAEAAALSPKAVGALRAGLVAFPFLCPLVAGPSVQAWQLLATWVCLAAMLLAVPVAVPARGIWAWLGAGAAAVVLFSSPHATAAAWLPAVVVLAAMAAAACIGAGMARGGPAVSEGLAVGVLAAGLVSAVLGLLQYYGLAEPLVPWTTTPALGQAYGNLRQRNQFATLISMALVAALWIHAAQPSARIRRWLVAAALLLLVAAAASTSRTGLLQLLSIVGVAAFIARRERRGVPAEHAGTPFSLPPPLVLLAMVPVYFAIAWVLPQLAAGEVEGMMQRLQEGAPGDHTRMILWRNVLSLIAAHPLAGWGWGELAFAHYSTLYDGPRFPEILDNAHNLPLHLAVEMGIPVSVLVCGGFLWMVMAARPWRERDPVRLMAWGMLGAIALHSLLEYPLWYGPFQLVFGLCLGMLWPAWGAATASSLRQRFKARWLEPPVLSSIAAAVLMAVVGCAAWDYIRISQIYLPRDERLPAYEDGTLAKAKKSWLFARQVDFAELTLTAVTPANAAAMHSLAERTLHFSPEPRVIVKLIESAELMGQGEAPRDQAERFRIAFPAEYERWLKGLPVDGQAP
ncbi:O-antigen ligase C-terminal domain-containing protein [Variovorax sp. VRV01]|uniref:PglL family O-oligosaccharyltransferase n=1 Tax=Variovorax sp. VRV01 TaxID=2769259 RepID=UPI001781A895|nr:Wzy polymerase domain-containing protein [Variovorax sp. VRV01]MBD9666168.1 O-antigen ligase C-terminal domain-containing protein [Variovorax sp. VRV01]